MNRVKKILTSCALLVLCLSTAAPARADVLSDLIANPANFLMSLDGCLKFDNFSYLAVGDMPAASGINVVPIVDSFGNYGIRFQGGFSDSPGNPAPSDALITYKVTVMPGCPLITDAHIFANIDIVADGPNTRGVITETFAPLENEMSVFETNLASQNSDVTFFDSPLSVLNVQKDIFLNAAAQDFVVMSFVDQTFSTQGVPEPASWALLCVGGLSALGYRRRLKASV